MQRKPLILLILLATLVLSACAVPGVATQNTTTPAQTIDSYAKPEALVDTAWIKEHLDDPSVRLLDISGKAETYAAGHLPGAHYVSLEEFTNPDDVVPGQVMTQEALSALFSRLGISAEDTVVLYDDNANLLSTRAYWVLKYYQHEDVRVYNGGTQKWTADGEALVTDTPAPTPGEYVAAAADPEIRTTWQYVVENTDDPGTLFCDTRGPEEYIGTDVRAARGGHIPGAINVEWRNAVNQDGTFRSAAALADLYQKAGFTPDKQIITYCQTGVRGAHTWFVLRELLGYPNVRNYDGSWVEYGNNEASVIER